MKTLYDVDPLDFAAMYRFCAECCIAKEEGRIITFTDIEYRVSNTGQLLTEPKPLKEQFDALADLVLVQIEMRKK